MTRPWGRRDTLINREPYTLGGVRTKRKNPKTVALTARLCRVLVRYENPLPASGLHWIRIRLVMDSGLVTLLPTLLVLALAIWSQRTLESVLAGALFAFLILEGPLFLDAMAGALMTYETIDELQMKDIMEGREPRVPEDWDSQPPPAAPSAQADVDKKDEPSVGGPAQQT